MLLGFKTIDIHPYIFDDIPNVIYFDLHVPFFPGSIIQNQVKVGLILINPNFLPLNLSLHSTLLFNHIHSDFLFQICKFIS